MTTLSEYHPDYRPESYWDDPEAVFANVKGIIRRNLLQNAVEDGEVEDLPPEAFADSLREESREAASAIHPMFMGGEYLQDYLPGEIEIARICMKTTTFDVISIRAIPTAEGKITYRVVDEYMDLWESEFRHPRLVTNVPLTNGEMIEFVASTRNPGDPNDTVEPDVIMYTWLRHVKDCISSLKSLDGFIWIESAFYPGLVEWHYDREADFLEEFVEPRIEKLEELEEKERRKREGEEETGCCVSRWRPPHDENE